MGDNRCLLRCELIVLPRVDRLPVFYKVLGPSFRRHIRMDGKLKAPGHKIDVIFPLSSYITEQHTLSQ